MSCKKCIKNHLGDIYVRCYCDCHKVVYLQRKNTIKQKQSEETK